MSYAVMLFRAGVHLSTVRRADRRIAEREFAETVERAQHRATRYRVPGRVELWSGTVLLDHIDAIPPPRVPQPRA